MRWLKEKVPHQDGDTRWRKEFALIPEGIGEYIIWLEYFWVREKYVVIGKAGFWITIKKELR